MNKIGIIGFPGEKVQWESSCKRQARVNRLLSIGNRRLNLGIKEKNNHYLVPGI